MQPPQFFFGAISPYSWFAAERIGEVIPAARWRPVFAGAIFKAYGRSSWGIGARRAERLADCVPLARVHGLGPISSPHPWPTSDVLIARAMTFAEREGSLRRFALQAMRSAFLEGGDLDDEAVVASVAQRPDLDPAIVIVIAAAAAAAAAATDATEQALRIRTDEALSLGVVRVPTIVVGAERFWGDDRLLDARRAIVETSAT